MRRYQLFEFLDQRWCPQIIRDGATDFLECISALANPYDAVSGPILAAIQATGSTSVVDLCSGGGGPWFGKQWRGARLEQQNSLHVCLTDKFPSSVLSNRLDSADPTLEIVGQSIDAARVPASLSGFRTIFASFHHFSDSSAKEILADAVQARQGIATAEVTSRTLHAALVICTLPFVVLVLTPRIRPFRWSRLFFTYIVPAIPMVVLWDGLVSCLRTRTPEELLALTTDHPEYAWTSSYGGSRGWRLPIVYLIGLPRSALPAPELNVDISNVPREFEQRDEQRYTSEEGSTAGEVFVCGPGVQQRPSSTRFEQRKDYPNAAEST